MPVSWGTKIACLYGGFVALIITLVTATFFHKSELVADNYYQQELQYQSRLDASHAAATLNEPLQILQQQESIVIVFPGRFMGQSLEGNLHFYAAARATADRNLPIQTSNDTMFVPRAALDHASYELQVSWSSAGTEYYQSLPLDLQ
jgi:hypothetical protein